MKFPGNGERGEPQNEQKIGEIDGLVFLLTFSVVSVFSVFFSGPAGGTLNREVRGNSPDFHRWIIKSSPKGGIVVIVMETTTQQDKVIRLQLPTWLRGKVLKFFVVLGLAGAGVGAVMAGLLAWVVGEQVLVVTGVVAGSVMISAGGLGLLRCLDKELR